MARIDSLTNFLTDVATAIKNKTGKTDAITPANFDTEIESIESGGGSGGKYAPRFISFYGYTGTELNDEITGLDTSNMTSMNGMFRICEKLTSLNLSSFSTEKVTSMQSMFDSCTSLTSLNLSSFNTPNLRYAQFLFTSCTKLTKIDMRQFVFTNVSNYTDMFGASATNGVPDDCLIIVADDTAKSWITSKFTRLTNVKTVAELEAS